MRLVVIHQLVLSLLVGPMLCCCTTARLGHDASTSPRGSTPPVSKQRKHCCGQDQKPSDGSQDAPEGKKPAHPAKCPCKDNPAHALADLEGSGGPLVALGSFTAVNVSLDASLSITDGLIVGPRLVSRFDHQFSGSSADQLLYAHHNLRC